MDTTKPSDFFITPAVLAAQLLGDSAPLIIDVRKNEAFHQSAFTLPRVLRREPADVGVWANDLPKAHAVLVYCVHGHEVSQQVAQILRHNGIAAKFLQKGIEGWHTAGLPMSNKVPYQNSRWITRARPKIDRIACPWLIRRFIDAQAEFLYVPTDQVKQVALTQNATAYDVAAHVTDTTFTHVGDLCSFDAFVNHYQLGKDLALARLAVIVRSADTDTLNSSPEAAGLLAISLGMSRTHNDDLAMLSAMMPVYDALYAWCKDKEAGQAEQHNWKPV